MTDESRLYLSLRGRKLLEEIRLREGYSERLSEAALERYQRAEISGEKIGLQRSEVRAKGMESKLRNGTLIPPNSGRGICGFRAGIPHYCRSTLEANFARVLLHFGVRYSYEPKVFKLTSGIIYVPDFLLLDPVPRYQITEGWVEMKGWRRGDGTVASEAKIQAFSAEHQTPVTIIAESDDLWKRITSEVSPSIPLWERPGRNLRTHPQVFAASAFLPIATQSECRV